MMPEVFVDKEVKRRCKTQKYNIAPYLVSELIEQTIILSLPPLASSSSVLFTKPKYPVLAHNVCGSPKLSLVLKWLA